MRVLKFGGSSVANSTNIKIVTEIISDHAQRPALVIVSALSGITDQLIKAGTLAASGNEQYKEVLTEIENRHLETTRNLVPVTSQSAILSQVKQYCNELEDILEGVFRLQELSPRTNDRIIAFGELLSSKIISSYWRAMGMQHAWIDSRQVVKTNSNYGYAEVNFEETNLRIKEFLRASEEHLFLAPGFISSNADGQVTTLGRGGSDYTASLYAAALDADALEIWTDVSGIMTADPRWVSHARPIPHISYQEAMELSHFGAKVIYPPTIAPVMKRNIPVWVKNTFAANDYGTLIEQKTSEAGDIIRGITSISNISLLSLEGSGMVGIPGFSKRLFESLASQQINVILITQSSSEHSICVGINGTDAAKAKSVVDAAFEYEIRIGILEPLQVENHLSIVALVGDRMKSHTGVSGQMFGALGRNGVNVRAIAQGSSERNISAVISSNDVKKAVNVLHEAFFEEVYKQLNVYLVGVGNVGSRLLGQIALQQAFLAQNLKLNLRVAGLANSRKMYFADEGVHLDNWKEMLDKGDPYTLDAFTQTIVQKNLRNSVFVDVTANDTVASAYKSMLVKSVHVVACNKVAASSAYIHYKQLKSLAREYNASFLFETNVGAGLPVIGTLNDLVKSGDKVNKIEAVLSGTLNYVFNNYRAEEPFASIVRRAQDEGYTEPDPRLDLGGTDVMRKILILAREAGYQLEMAEIENNGFLPASCFEGTVDDFYAEMLKHEEHFKTLYQAAHDQDCKLKFVATFSDEKTSVGLQHIPTWHDFYHLYGKDNIVLFYTQRYPEQPLVVKGAGAGADVTASGVFADIIRIASV
jgi:aspartokinase/homoserine dehydrogenase 1